MPNVLLTHSVGAFSALLSDKALSTPVVFEAACSSDQTRLFKHSSISHYQCISSARNKL